jgi:outer membrane protein assembly factor BamB
VPCAGVSTPAELVNESSPAMIDGAVYMGSWDRHVWAVDARSGETRWRHATGSAVAASPAVADGTVHIGSWDTHLWALYAASGHERWRFKTNGGVRSRPVVADGVVYFGRQRRRLPGARRGLRRPPVAGPRR